jgi:hypothetical protein
MMSVSPDIIALSRLLASLVRHRLTRHLDFRRLIRYVPVSFATNRREACMIRMYLPFSPGGAER